MTESEIFVGLGLLLALAVGCQVVAERVRVPAIVLLLPVGFAAGRLTRTVDPTALFGRAFTPMVSLAVAVILFEGGLHLRRRVTSRATASGSSAASCSAAWSSPGSARR